jgi:hypothetical protein
MAAGASPNEGDLCPRSLVRSSNHGGLEVCDPLFRRVNQYAAVFTFAGSPALARYRYHCATFMLRCSFTVDVGVLIN